MSRETAMNERIFYGKCPLCDSVALEDAYTASCATHPLYRQELSPIMRWKRCIPCRHVFTEGYFTEEVCRLIFTATNENQQVGFELEQQRHVSARIVEKILPYASSGHWLDVGFGNGSLLFTVQEYGFVPVGIDLRRENAQRMADLGVRSYWEDIARLSLDFECSVISMADVLEHMPFPRAGLQAAYRLLKQGGILFLSMPNTESAIWQALNENQANPYWGEIEHYHNFSRSRLFQLLRDNGFDPLRYGISERYRASMEVVAQKR